MSPADPYRPETMHADLSDRFRHVIDANLYMTIASADEVGSPWASPVYFAHADYREFIWVSKPGARHSQNIAVRPYVGIAVYDSHAPIGTGGGVYVEATAEQLLGEDRLPALEVFSARSVAHGGEPFGLPDVEPPSALQVYRATAGQHWVLDERDLRIPVTV